MDYLDRFYARERVRHFIGNGLALYAKHGCPVSPFLDARWVRAAAGLNRREKLGSNFHRRVIQRNYPALLAHPIGASETMAPVAPAGYWKQSSIPVSYSPASELLRRAEVTDILAESPHLRVLMPQHAVARVVATGTAEVKEFLLTTHFAGEAAAHVSS
jgi:hypothetical protein